MAKNVPIETQRILDNLGMDTLQTLVNIANDKKNIDNFRSVLELLAVMEQNFILKGAGLATSLDSMIDTSSKSSFSRGKLAGYTLINSLITHAPRFMDKRMEKGDKKNAKSSR